MDWITQAFLGAALGELILGKRLGNRAMAWGALLGVLPESERLLGVFFQTAGELALHRGPGHSLLMMALGCYGLTRGLGKLWAREKIPKSQIGGFVVSIGCAHVMADCLTPGGAALLWPFSGKIFSLGVLAETDFFLSAPLAVTVVWMAFLREAKARKTRGKKPVPLSKRRRLCYLGLGLSAGYGMVSAGLSFVASAGFDADLERRGVTFERRMQTPTSYNSLLWRSVVDRGDELWVGYRSVFEFPDSPVRWTVYPRRAEMIAPVADMRETRILMNFTDGWWIARPHVKGAWIGDLRHGETRVWGSKEGAVHSRLAHSWVVDRTAIGDALRPASPDSGAATETLQRMAARIIGKCDQWEASPRLAGISGSLPEFLPIHE